MAEVIQGVFPGGDAPLRYASVAAMNLSPEPGDTEGNLLLAERAIVEARQEDPSLRWVVLPELFTCGYSALESVHDHAEDAERGESARFFLALAGPVPRPTSYLPSSSAGFRSSSGRTEERRAPRSRQIPRPTRKKESPATEATSARKILSAPSGCPSAETANASRRATLTAAKTAATETTPTLITSPRHPERTLLLP
ncbi:MAG: nitrilase-related carbon-nitrogen hydrolase [Rubrobacter sp.]